MSTALPRRSVLSLGIGAGLALGLPAGAWAAPTDQPVIRPRSDWAKGLAPQGQLTTEAAGDVRFLLIHHSESPNTDRPGATPDRLRGFYRYHTSTKQWPDVAYNFFVDRHGEIWEGRAGSLTGPVRGDATGESQGYAQLCCFVGDHTSTPPTPAAMAAMTSLLAWLSTRYAIDLAAGPTITFTSRGSNRWPQGTRVTTEPIAGHRDMSQTTCPGDALYPLIQSTLLPGAAELQGRGEPAPTLSTTPAESPTPTQATPGPTGSGQTPSADPPVASEFPEMLSEAALPLMAGATLLGAAGVGAVVLRGRRT